MALTPGTRMHDSGEIETVYGASTLTTVTPLTGATVTMGFGQLYLFVNPAGTLSTLTILLPPNPALNQKAAFSFSQTVTTLTIQSATGAAVGTTAGVIASELSCRFVGGVWVLWD